MQSPLPDHLIESARRALVTELPQKEVLKLLPNFDQAGQRALNRDIAAWPAGGAAYHLSAVKRQDFLGQF